MTAAQFSLTPMSSTVANGFSEPEPMESKIMGRLIENYASQSRFDREDHSSPCRWLSAIAADHESNSWVGNGGLFVDRNLEDPRQQLAGIPLNANAAVEWAFEALLNHQPESAGHSNADDRTTAVIHPIPTKINPLRSLEPGPVKRNTKARKSVPQRLLAFAQELERNDPTISAEAIALKYRKRFSREKGLRSVEKLVETLYRARADAKRRTRRQETQ